MEVVAAVAEVVAEVVAVLVAALALLGVAALDIPLR